MEKCPNGYICLNREIGLLITIAIISLAIYGFTHREKISQSVQLPDKLKELEENVKNQHNRIDQIQDRNWNREKNDVLLYPEIDNNLIHHREVQKIYDPLLGPERHYPYIVSNPVLPINIPTRGYITEYQQVGALYGLESIQKTRILPLYGKPTYPGSNKWSYYTSSDDYHTVKIPIYKDGRKCQGDYGCDELYTGDLVNVNPYSTKFKVELYEIDKPRYIPTIF